MNPTGRFRVTSNGAMFRVERWWERKVFGVWTTGEWLVEYFERSDSHWIACMLNWRDAKGIFDTRGKAERALFDAEEQWAARQERERLVKRPWRPVPPLAVPTQDEPGSEYLEPASFFRIEEWARHHGWTIECKDDDPTRVGTTCVMRDKFGHEASGRAEGPFSAACKAWRLAAGMECRDLVAGLGIEKDDTATMGAWARDNGWSCDTMRRGDGVWVCTMAHAETPAVYVGMGADIASAVRRAWTWAAGMDDYERDMWLTGALKSRYVVELVDAMDTGEL